eukprot:scaffold8085_cov127-Isochrysis_galbana.AAC.1
MRHSHRGAVAYHFRVHARQRAFVSFRGRGGVEQQEEGRQAAQSHGACASLAGKVVVGQATAAERQGRPASDQARRWQTHHVWWVLQSKIRA